ncbi:hypothetical protein [Autumnicola musiva]|uniref:Uncharacterized protein n=1 Tax=Autumnicola musiva TaxID=3075589 RepID=A0ABU3D7M1_9FLAO|nr:hypothetical protein [Zunongwangia sp. F117]MDT0677527.1 hypothetical protein [Zunongwangia sp. F117]
MRLAKEWGGGSLAFGRRYHHHIWHWPRTDWPKKKHRKMYLSAMLPVSPNFISA